MTSQTSHEPTQDRPALQLNVPVSLVRLSGSPDKAVLAQSGEVNSRLFKLFYYLDRQRSDLRHDESEDYPEDMFRLELKLDYLIDLVSSMVIVQNPKPDPIPIQLTTEYLSWQGVDMDLRPEEWVQAQLYLPGIPHKAVELVGQMGADDITQTAEQTLFFKQNQEGGGDWLDRLIFREHRRHIARLKQP